LIATISSYTVGAVTGDLTTAESVKINGILIENNTEISVIAGDSIVVQVFFDSQ